MRIAFIGLGTMGLPMAHNLQVAGHALTVHDVRREAAAPLLARGGHWADSPREAAARAEVILTSLPGPAEVEAVALGPDGILAGVRPGGTYVDLSTNAVGLIRHLHARFAGRGVAMLDAPVSGGPSGAERGTLQIIVGGDAADFARVRPLLAALGDKLTYVGPIGCGTIAKLVHNTVNACAFRALAEGFTLGVKAGLEPEKLLAVLQGGNFGQGYNLRVRLPEIVFAGDFDAPRFSLALLHKDVGLALALAHEYDVPMGLAELTERDLGEALARGWGGRDSAATFLLQEERAGVTVRTSVAGGESLAPHG